MFHFSKISKSRLNTCHEDLRNLFNEVIKGYDCTIVCGHRGEIEQNEAFANGYSKLQWPNSKHNSMPSDAVDAVPYESNHLDWGKLQSAYFAGYVKGIADNMYYEGQMYHKIRCGLDWDKDNDIDDTDFWDGAHFEIIR